MATTSLSEFTALIKKGQFLKKYNYEVIIPGAPRTLTLRCESFVIPGQNIETSVDNIHIGPTREHAFSATYAPVTGVFLCDAEFSEKRFFDAWQDKIFDKETFKVKLIYLKNA